MQDFYAQYPPEFQDLLKRDFGEDSYIGQGNPASKILIIGKELGLEKTDKNGQLTLPYIRELLDNASDWKNKSPENIPNFFEARSWDAYHPRRPFYGQIMLKDNNASKKPKSWDELNRGTSVTWKAQQQFINLLLPEEQQVQPRQLLNFYEHSFMTDLSCNCMKTSVKNDETKQSIERRISKDGILAQPFFRKFPVVIFDIYHYFDWYNDLQIIQNFDGGVLNYTYKGIIVSEETYSHYDEATKSRMPLYRANNGFGKGDFINVHESADGKHILLHTSHFVDNYQPRSLVWMKELADVVRPYLK